MPATLHIPRSAPWLPPSLLFYPGEIRHTVRLCESERKIFRRSKKRRPSQWCELHRVVTLSRLPGKWKNEVTPYLAGIMDASFFHSVREIIICAGPQTGKTEAVINCIASAIDQEPGPTIMVYPDEKTAKENNQDRIQPMIKSSPRLRSYMTGLSDDMSQERIGLIHMPIYFGWARSASSMANKPCRYAVNDEVDKGGDSKRETSAILQTKNRLTTYDGEEKHWIISSPSVETGPIWKYFKAAQVRFDYHVKCPICNAAHGMTFDQIKWKHQDIPGPDGVCHSEDPELIESDKLAWYECPHCLAKWNDYERDIAVRHGHWQDRESGLKLFEYLLKHLPAKIAFHIPSWLSTFVSLSKTAACFLRGRSDVDEFKNFYNKHKAEPWKLTVISKSEEQILSARCALLPQTVPAEALALTIGVDVQKNGFWFAVRAWTAELTSWLIHYGFLPLWQDVEKQMFETAYPVAGDPGRSLRIFRACVDTGGGRKYDDMTMTEETYFWILKNKGRNGVALWGTKGASNALPTMLNMGVSLMSTPSGKKLPEALRLISIDTAKAKDQYHYRLKLAGNEDTRSLPGAGFLHAGTGSDYAQQILAEEKQVDDKGHELWVNEHQRPNHYLDAEVLAAACVEMEYPGGSLRLLAAYVEQMKQEQAMKKSKPENPAQQSGRFW